MSENKTQKCKCPKKPDVKINFNIDYEIEVEGKEGGLTRIRVKADSVKNVFELFKLVREEVFKK